MTQKTPLIIILIFATLVIAGSLFVFFQKQGAVNAPFNVGQKPPVQTPQTNSIPKDWKTYRNLKMKFEIKYPPDWKVDEQVNVVNGNIGAVIIYKGEKKLQFQVLRFLLIVTIWEFQYLKKAKLVEIVI